MTVERDRESGMIRMYICILNIRSNTFLSTYTVQFKNINMLQYITFTRDVTYSHSSSMSLTFVCIFMFSLHSGRKRSCSWLNELKPRQTWIVVTHIFEIPSKLLYFPQCSQRVSWSLIVLITHHPEEAKTLHSVCVSYSETERINAYLCEWQLQNTHMNHISLFIEKFSWKHRVYSFYI